MSPVNGRLVLALVFLVGGAGVALAGAQPQASLTPAQAQERSGEVRVKGEVASVDADADRFVLAGGGGNVTVAMQHVPAAVTPGKSLLAEGELHTEDGEAVLSAREVQLGCPSKY